MGTVLFVSKYWQPTWLIVRVGREGLRLTETVDPSHKKKKRRWPCGKLVGNHRKPQENMGLKWDL